jgi:hypothetical protein
MADRPKKSPSARKKDPAPTPAQGKSPGPKRASRAQGSSDAAAPKTSEAERPSSARVPSGPAKPRGKVPSGKRKVGKGLAKPKVERPDELSRETFEFIAAIDEFKRRTLANHLGMPEVLRVLHELGYRARPSDAARAEGQLSFACEALEAYKRAHKRLFPNWSEVFAVLRESGYSRSGDGHSPSGESEDPAA